MSEIDEQENQALDELASTFLRALAHKDAGRVDEAEEALREILHKEPRLAEPHLELARLLLDTDRVHAAEPHAREALRWLEAGGLWTDEIPENVVQGIAHALLAEILRRRADEDDVIFGDPAQYHALVAESREHFAQANALDPSDEYSSYHAFFLGIPGKKEESETLDGDMDVPLIPGGPLPGEA